MTQQLSLTASNISALDWADSSALEPFFNIYLAADNIYDTSGCIEQATNLLQIAFTIENLMKHQLWLFKN